MRPEMVKAIRNQWNFCSVEMQKSLIRRYLEMNGRELNQESKWLHFLASEFGLGESKNNMFQAVLS